jgi:energy-coupling factor transporter ATP-binding protein EcfA2
MKKGGTARLLLLGTGESGKSTIFKQMKIIHKDGYDPAECMKHKDVIYGNILQSIRVMIDAVTKLNINWGSESARALAQDFMEIPEQKITMDPLAIMNDDLGKQIKQLWQDSGIKEAYERRAEYQLNDSTNYFLDAIDRIASSNYQPTRQDVLRSRVKTVGIVEADFVIDGHNFKIIDVGGYVCHNML